MRQPGTPEPLINVLRLDDDAFVYHARVLVFLPFMDSRACSLLFNRSIRSSQQCPRARVRPANRKIPRLRGRPGRFFFALEFAGRNARSPRWVQRID